MYKYTQTHTHTHTHTQTHTHTHTHTGLCLDLSPGLALVHCNFCVANTCCETLASTSQILLFFERFEVNLLPRVSLGEPLDFSSLISLTTRQINPQPDISILPWGGFSQISWPSLWTFHLVLNMVCFSRYPIRRATCYGRLYCGGTGPCLISWPLQTNKIESRTGHLGTSLCLWLQDATALCLCKR